MGIGLSERDGSQGRRALSSRLILLQGLHKNIEYAYAYNMEQEMKRLTKYSCFIPLVCTVSAIIWFSLPIIYQIRKDIKYPVQRIAL